MPRKKVDVMQVMVDNLKRADEQEPLDYASVPYPEEMLYEIAASHTLAIMNGVLQDMESDRADPLAFSAYVAPTLSRLLLENLVLTIQLGQIRNPSQAKDETEMLMNILALKSKK